MLTKKIYLSLALVTGFFIACSSTDLTDEEISDEETANRGTIDDSRIEPNPPRDEEGEEEGEEDSTTYLITEDLLNSDSLISFDIVSAELENGSTVDCYQIVFSGNPERFDTGPYCPETDEDTAGMSFYDGDTGAGLRVWEKSLLDDIETDGYDIVDEDGTVHVDDFSGTTDSDPDTYSYCLDGADQDVEITFLIPVTPVLANEVNEIEEVELVGMSVDGVPINGQPPSAIWGPVQNIEDGAAEPTIINIPSLDPCGGHNDPRGYYHWHLIPEVANKVLTANGIDQITCTNIEQTTDKVLSGFAKDGYPIYAYAVEPDGLDDCGGLEAETDEYPDGVYHYVASTTVAPNVPQCLVGVSVERDQYVIN